MRTLRASIGEDPIRRTIYLHVGYVDPQGGVRVVTWGPSTVTPVPEGEAVPQHLSTPLTDEVARALYEALAEHYGHSGNDTRALRRDYDAERGRVDRLISHLTRGER